MREPRLANLEFDSKGTSRIRRRMSRNGAVKITINIDSHALSTLRMRSAETGIPYQRLLNQVLKRALAEEKKSETRLDRLERDLRRLKRMIAA